MIVVFVVDTSPSMAAAANSSGGDKGGVIAARGISKLDFAKMSVENLARSMDKRIMENNRCVLLKSAQVAAAKKNKQQSQQQDVGRLEQFDEFLLLSTSLQPDIVPQHQSDDGTTSTSNVPTLEAIAEAAEAHASCGAGGRLLVGSIEDDRLLNNMDNINSLPHPVDRADFEHELKRLRTATLPSSQSSEKKKVFPEWAGGANGLNAALSHGLGLLSRYRLTRGRVVEHFGMGRLPSHEHQMTKLTKDDVSNTGNYNSPLQPACLVLLTDGECLRLPPELGGGQLSLRFGNMPLREFYREPFRWDQRIFILHIGNASTPPLHKSLRALCEVTGGCYMKVNPSQPSLQKILTRISPPKPRQHSIPDPLRLPSMPTQVVPDEQIDGQIDNTSNLFVNGGPICSFQCLEGGGQGMPSLHRAMLLFSGSCEQQRWILANGSDTSSSSQVQTPIWNIPESHFPSKKLDTLPPRPSQPLLHYSRNFQGVGSQVFDPYYVMKALHHLDKLNVTIRQLLVAAGDSPPPIINRMIQRDVYICDWLGEHESTAKDETSNSSGAPRTVAGREHFPVCCRGAGRPSLSGEGSDNILNVGILHVPHNWLKLKDVAKTDMSSMSDKKLEERLPTLTLLPPDADRLIPLLIKIAEMELRIIKKIDSKEVASRSGATSGLIKKKVNSAAAARAIHMDENWKADFRAYLVRLPPYYLPAVRRVLRPMLPPSVVSLLNFDSQESLPLLCFSPTCLVKIQNGEKSARNSNDWLRNNELRMQRTTSMQEVQMAAENVQNMGRSLVGQRGRQNMTAEVSFGYGQYDPRMTEHQYLNMLRNLPPPWKNGHQEAPVNTSLPSRIALLPKSCLLPYYESRRRWIFGGTGLTTRGLHVEGVNNDGTNTHRYNASDKPDDQPLLALAGLANTTSSAPIARMGDFKERLNFTPVSFVDYGTSTGASITTSSNGSPQYSVDDDVLPLNFFDNTTGDFTDSPEARARARLMISFGNPFNDRRGSSVVPAKYADQRPPLQGNEGPSTPPGSPPHSTYVDSHSPIEGEGEAAFTASSRPSPPRGTKKMIDSKLLGQKRKMDAPPLEAKEGKQAKPQPPLAAPSSQARPPPPKRPSSSSPRPPPPPKPSQPHTNKPQKPSAKPAPPRRQNSKDGQHQAQKQTPHKGGPSSKPVTWQSSEGSSSTQASSPQQHKDITEQLQNQSVKPSIKLPEGWICVWSKSQKRWYFFDTSTNKSVWDPRLIGK